VTIVRLSGVHLRYGSVAALAGVDFEVGAGERVALIGPSGAGKSSVIRLLNGTASASEGSVRVLGCDLGAASPRAVRDVQRRVGTVHQRFDLVEQLRVVHNVNAGRLGAWSFWRAALSLLVPREAAQARQALDRVGIGDKLHERTANLSGGQQQRVAIARVLVQRPELILADEPIASLDPARGREVIDLLHRVGEETGSTVVASLHDVDVAMDRFDRVIGLRQGRVAFDAPPAQLRREQLDELYALERTQGQR
jgi:phosphonate transport system ATP-binding protein